MSDRKSERKRERERERERERKGGLKESEAARTERVFVLKKGE